MLPCAGILGGSPPAAGPVLPPQKRDIFSIVLSLQRPHGQSSRHCVQPRPDHVMSWAPLSLTSVVLHMDVVNVYAVLLLHGVGHPATLRVPLLAEFSLQRGELQRHIGTLHATVLLKGALIELPALGTRAAEEWGGVGVERLLGHEV